MKKIMLDNKKYILIGISCLIFFILMFCYCRHYTTSVIPENRLVVERRPHSHQKSIEIEDADTSLTTPASDYPIVNTKASATELISSMNIDAASEYLLKENNEGFIQDTVIQEKIFQESSIPETFEQETTEESEEVTEQKEYSFRVKSDVNLLNMRSEPDSSASIVAKLTSISRGKVLEYDENWAHVKTTNYEGYVATQFIIISE